MPTFSRAFPQPDPLAQALGLISWSYEPQVAAVQLAPTSQTIFFSSVWLPAGVAVGNLVFGVTVAAVAPTPTSVVVGIADSAGVMVAQSGELKASTKWLALGFAKVPLAASYSPPTAGYYRLLFLQNGTFTTPLQLTNRTIATVGATKGDLSFEPWGTAGTAATALPANGSSLSSIALNSQEIWMAAAA